jgi:malate permease and related proteins
MKLTVFETILAFALVVVLALMLRRRSVIPAESTPMFARLLTRVVLPAVIIAHLGRNPIHERQLLLIVAMLSSGFGVLLLAYLAGLALRLPRPTQGALMITSSFGSSALLGYPLVQFAFPGNELAMQDAILLSELGVGLPIFTVCPLIAMWFSDGAAGRPPLRKLFTEYFTSPVFFAVVIGLLLPFLPLRQDGFVMATLFKALGMLDGSLTVLACLVLGMQLRVPSIRRIVPLVIVSGAIQMGAQPWLAALQARWFHLAAEQQQVLVLITAMPAAVLGPVFAVQYNCDGETASALTFTHILLSVIVIPCTFSMFT